MKPILNDIPGFCGVMSVFSSLRYCIQDNPHNYTNLYLALGLVPLGLFFDFMDGKVARWRKKASLMGQELDSLADLVRSLPHTSPNIVTRTDRICTDLLRRRPRRRGFRSRPPHPHRPPAPHLLRPLRPDPPRALQRDRRHGAQRRVGQVKVLRGHAHSHELD